MAARLRILVVGLVCVVLAGCSGGPSVVPDGWVRYHNGLGWSMSYPKSLYIQSVRPAPPMIGLVTAGALVTSVTLASFSNNHGTDLGLSRSRRLPPDGMVLQIGGGTDSASEREPFRQIAPLRLAAFRPGAHPAIWRQNGFAVPLERTVELGDQRYTIQVWIGPRASAELRSIVAKIIASITFTPVQAGHS